MAYTLTLDDRILKSGLTENVIVLTDTSGSTNQEIGIAVDYSDYYSRIATAIERIADNSDRIESHLNSYDFTFEVTVSSITDTFEENENVVAGAATGRILKIIGNRFYIDSVDGIIAEGSSLSGVTSTASATVDTVKTVKTLANELTEYTRQSDMYNVILENESDSSSESISWNSYGTPSTPGSITIKETDTLTLSSSGSTAEDIYIVPINNPSNLDQAKLLGNSIQGQGTKTITWQPEYRQAGTYYYFSQSKIASGTITVESRGYIPGEKVTNQDGLIGYVDSYNILPDINKRFISIYNVQNQYGGNDFSVDDVITGEVSTIAATVTQVSLNNFAGSKSSGSGGDDTINTFTLAALYKSYITGGDILTGVTEASSDEQQRAIQEIVKLASQARSSV